MLAVLAILYSLLRAFRFQNSCMLSESPLFTECYGCDPDYYSPFETSSFDNLFSASYCVKKKYQEQILDIFIQESPCNLPEGCNGTIWFPFDNFIQALEYAHLKSNENLNSSINFYLIGKMHFITQSDLDKSSVKHFFRKNNASIKIKPFSYYESSDKHVPQPGEAIPTLILKTNKLKIFVSGSFEVRDLAILGADLALQNEECSNIKRICCNIQTLTDYYDENTQGAVDCGLKGFENLKPKYRPTWGLFNIDNLFGTLTNSSANFTLINTNISKLILLNPRGEEATNSIFTFLAIGRGPSYKIFFKNVSLEDSFLSNGMLTIENFYSTFTYIKYPGEKEVSANFSENEGNSEIILCGVTVTRYNLYKIISLQPKQEALLLLQEYAGRVVIETFLFKEFYGPILYFKIFDFSYNKNEINISEIVIKDCGSHIFLHCTACIKVLMINLQFLNLIKVKREIDDNYIKISAEFSSLSNINFIDVDFEQSSNNDRFTLFIETTKNDTMISNMLVERALEWNIFFSLGTVLIRNMLIIDCLFSQTIIHFHHSSVNANTIIVRNFILNHYRGFEIRTNKGNDSINPDIKICLFNILLVSNYFIGGNYDYSQFLLWSGSGISDKLLLNNTLFENVTTSNPINDHSFFSSYFVNQLEFYNSLIINFDDGCPPMFIIMYDFNLLKVINITFKNINRNRYYLFAVGGSGDLFLLNMNVSETSLHYDSFFITARFFFLENVIFSNIYSVTRLIWYIFTLRYTMIASVKNFKFISSEYGVYDPSDYGSPFGTNIINFETCHRVYFEAGFFEILRTNTAMNELFLFSSKSNLNISISQLYVVNFNCLNGYSGDPIYENGIISFISSYSYIYGASVNSIVILDGIVIEDSQHCKNGALGFLNIENVIINNITAKNTRSHLGGVLCFNFCNFVRIQYLNTFMSEALKNGGVIFSRGCSQISLINSFIDYAKSISGGAFYFRDTKINFFVENIKVNQSFAQIDGGCVLLLETSCMINGSSFFYAHSLGDGGAIHLKGKNLTISNNFLCFGSWATFGGCLFVENSDFLSLDSIVVINAEASVKGGFVHVYDVKYSAELISLNLYNVIIKEGAGVINIENHGEVLFVLENITISESLALECFFLSFDSIGSLFIRDILLIRNWGSAMSLSSQSLSKTQNISIQNLTAIGHTDLNYVLLNIENLFVLQGINYLFMSNITLRNLYFSHFGLRLLGSKVKVYQLSIINELSFNGFEPYFFSLQESSLCLETLQFEGQSEQGLGFLIAIHSDIIFNNLSVYKCQTQANSCIKLDYSNISVANSEFKQCKANLVGVFSMSFCSIKFQKIHFYNNGFTNKYSLELHPLESAANIYVYDSSQAEILLCDFFDSALGTQILSINTNILIRLSKFSAVEKAVNVKALWAINSSTNISFSDFKYFCSYKGGALRLENVGLGGIQKFSIMNSTFQDCISDQGGAYFVRGFYEIIIIYNDFIGNSALKLNQKSFALAGVGYFDSENTKIQSLLILSHNKFIGNKAEGMFPVLFSTVKIELSTSNDFNSNQDGLNLTERLSSFPVNLKLYLDNNLIDIAEGIEIVSGQPFGLKVETYDFYNQRFIHDNISRAYIEPSKSSNFSLFFRSFQHWARAKKGVFLFSSIVINVFPGSNFELNLSVILNQEPFGISNPLSQNLLLKTYSRPCKSGEIFLSSSRTCLKCPEGQYSIGFSDMSSSNNAKSCSQCPDNAFCPGGDIILPYPGYWKLSNKSTQMKECIVQKACLGVSVFNFYGGNLVNFTIESSQAPCLKNNKGPFCFLCERDAARFDETDVCVPCKINVLTYLKPILLLIIFSFYIILHVTLTLKTSAKRTFSSPLLKQLINHFQSLGMISLVGIDLKYGIDGFFKAQEYFLVFGLYDFPVECFISDVDFNMYSLKVIFSTIAPFLLFLTTFLLWGLFFCFSKFKTKEKFVDQMLLTIILIISLLFPMIIRSCFSLLKCISIDDSSEKQVLLYSPDVDCWEDEHKRFIIAALPGLILWGICYPIYLSLQLFRNRVWIKDIIKIYRRKDTFNQEYSKAYKLLGSLRSSFRQNYTLTVGDVGGGRRRRGNFIFPSNHTEKNATDMMANIKKLVQVLEKGDQVGTEANNFSGRTVYSEEKINTIFNEHVFSFKKRSILNDIHLFSSRKKSVDLNLRRSNILKYLYQGYSSKYYYWEIVVFLRKFLLILLGNLNYVLPAGMLRLLLIIMIGAFTISQMRRKPYVTEYLNSIQFFSSLTIFLTVFFGIIGSSGFQSILIFIVVMLINILFFTYWVKNFWTHSLKNFSFIQNYYNKFRNFLCCRKLRRSRMINVSETENFTENEENGGIFS